MALPSAQAAVMAKIKTRLAGHVQLSKNEERATTSRVRTRSGYQISGATACVRLCDKKNLVISRKLLFRLVVGFDEIGQLRYDPISSLLGQTYG